VFILDTGIDYTHLDLQGRVDMTRSVDLLGTFTVNGVPFTEADTVQKYFPGRAAFYRSLLPWDPCRGDGVE
jgi:hypothetical protein